MIEFSASVTSSRTSIASYQATSERNSLSIQGEQGHHKAPPPSDLNNQQRQIIDEVDISQSAIQQFEDAQILINELQNYVDYLNGDASENLVQIVANDNEADVTIAGQSTKLSASITVAKYEEETLSISGSIDDDGNLTELTVSKESISAEYISAEVSFEEFSFFARG